MKTLEIKEFPKGSMSFNTIFEYYLQTLEGKIFKQLKGFSKLSIRNSLDDFSNKLYPDNIWESRLWMLWKFLINMIMAKANLPYLIC